MFTQRTLILAFITTLALGGFNLAHSETGQVPSMEERLTQIETKLDMILDKIAAAEKSESREQEARVRLGDINKLARSGKMAEAKEQMAEFMKTYSNTEAAQYARQISAQLDVIGKSEPEDYGIEKWFQGEKDTDLGQGKATLLVFWEEWCPHCRREVPKLQKMYEENHKKGLQMVGLTKITRSATEEKVTDFIQENGLTYPMAKETGEVSRYFNVSGVPAAAVVKDGKVVWRGHPAQINKSLIKGWL